MVSRKKKTAGKQTWSKQHRFQILPKMFLLGLKDTFNKQNLQRNFKRFKNYSKQMSYENNTYLATESVIRLPCTAV